MKVFVSSAPPARCQRSLALRGIAQHVLGVAEPARQPRERVVKQFPPGRALNRAAAFTAPEAFISPSQVMYERTKNSEIDFVGPKLGVPFECKYTDGNWRRGTHGMVPRYRKGVIATHSPLAVGAGERVWAIPAAMVAWLLPGVVD